MGASPRTDASNERISRQINVGRTSDPLSSQQARVSASETTCGDENVDGANFTAQTVGQPTL
jgi:hypothetical protein